MLFLLLALMALPGRAGATQAGLPDPSAQCRAAIRLAERERNLPPGLLGAIAQVESGRRDPQTGRVGPWPWTINAEGQGRYFPTREEAIAHVRQLQARGVRIIDVGCMQINLHHHPNAFPSLEQAFDPVTNARYAAQFLTELNATRQDWQRSAGHYHSNTPERAEAYRSRVMAAWTGEQRRGSDPADRLADAWALTRRSGSGGDGPLSLSNRAERAQIIPMAQGLGAVGTAGAGRGLDAYRALPIPGVGRSLLALQMPLRR
jgi:hypothetical protein